MDLQLFTNIVKDLLSKQDKVIINKFGIFSAEEIPAYFSDKGFTINPPYRKVSFSLCDQEDDTLAQVYAQSNGIGITHARVVVDDFIDALRILVMRNKMVDLPDFGRLRVFGTDKIFFIQSKDLSIFPQYDYLEPVSLRSMGTLPVATEEPASVQRMMSTLPSQLTDQETGRADVPEVASGQETVGNFESVPESDQEPECESVPEPETVVVPEPETVAVPEPECDSELDHVKEPAAVMTDDNEGETPGAVSIAGKSGNFLRKPATVLISVVVAILVFLALLAVLGRCCHEVVDPLLYSEEELEILNYQMK